MPTTAKIQVRSGNLTDLSTAKLAPSEFGYAKDVNRLFIGNDPVTRNGNGSSSIDFGVDLDGLAGTYLIEINGAAISSGTYTVDNMVVTFSGSYTTTDVAVLYYNTEVHTIAPDSGVQLPTSTALVSSLSASTGIIIDSTRYNWVEIEYTLSHDSLIRSGKLHLGLNYDSSTSTTAFTITDTHNTNATGNDLNHVFSGSAVNELVTINYSTNDLVQTNLNYIIKSWQSI